MSLFVPSTVQSMGHEMTKKKVKFSAIIASASLRKGK